MRNKDMKSSSIDNSHELLRSILKFMKDNEGLSLSDVIELYSAGNDIEAIPLSIFSHELSPSESLCKYLKENKSLSFHEIAVLINRDDRSIWTSYNRAIGKMKGSFVPNENEVLLPVSIFTDRKKSILENVVYFLKEKHSYSNSHIANILNKNHSSIATVSGRASRKEGN